MTNQADRMEQQQMRDEYHAMEERVTALEDKCDRLRELLQRTVDELFIIDESEGVVGWHLNGDVSPWSESALPELRDDIITALEGRDDSTEGHGDLVLRTATGQGESVTVYLVSASDYSNYEILGVFSTEEKAADYAKKAEEDFPSFKDDTRIEKYLLDHGEYGHE